MNTAGQHKAKNKGPENVASQLTPLAHKNILFATAQYQKNLARRRLIITLLLIISGAIFTVGIFWFYQEMKKEKESVSQESLSLKEMLKQEHGKVGQNRKEELFPSFSNAKKPLEEIKKIVPRGTQADDNEKSNDIDLPSEVGASPPTLDENQRQKVLEMIKKGVGLEDKSNLKLAVTTYKKALQINPRDADIHLALCRCYFELDDLQKVSEHALKALSSNNKHPEPYLWLGHYHYSQQNHCQAKRTYQNYLRLEPHNPHADEIRIIIKGMKNTAQCP